MRKYVTVLVAAVVVAASLSMGAAPASAAAGNYIPSSGPTFNDPYGSKAEVRAIISELNKTIDSVPKGGKIRVASWNLRSHNIGAALIRAHRRGVSVQVIMDRHNWNPNNPNVDAQRVAQAFKGKKNKKRPKGMKSWVKRCKGSCRGTSGIAHTKFFLFDKVRGKKNKKTGKRNIAKHVMMYGSYNATELGATIQWNDQYTFRGQKKRYQLFNKVFKQMRRDKPQKQAFVKFNNGKAATHFYPYTGKGTKVDPVMKIFNKVRCTGASTHNGRTRIRIAQTAMHGERGLRLARRIAQLQNQGCDIRLVYAMFGNRVLSILRGAGVPLTHLAWDSNADGVYDRYLHAKSMTIVGHYNGKPGQRITWNGSANWTQTAINSDEVVGVIRRRATTRDYSKWINKLFASRPPEWDVASAFGRSFLGETPFGPGRDHLVVERNLRERGIDPYELIKQEI